MLKLEQLTIDSKASIKEALQIINNNERGICFVIEGKKLVGIATDGDIRRSLLRGVEINHSIASIMNRNFVSLPVESKENIKQNE